MRLVKWSPQERVDVPDITAMQTLVLGEFRRTVRGLLLGPGAVPATARHDVAIVRGFKVEPQAVPDATIRVRLDPGTDILGFAIGAENLGASIDFGQLVGGDDTAGITEGNASQNFDFTGQPDPVTYTLRMRFVYADGTPDNRAFWDEGIPSEFIASVDTRVLAGFELSIVTTGAEWFDLADVVWDGVSIDAADITDLRTFLFEGTTPFTATTQAAYTALADFSRSNLRGDNGVNEVYGVLRALGRQIADLKGPDSSGGFNWYARAFAPIDPAASGIAAEQTKSVRSVDTVTYTVGDGVGSFGDFNGASGLEQALDAIATGATRPRRVKIVLKAGDRGAITQLVTNVYDFTAGGGTELSLEIVAESTNGAGGGVDNGRAAITFTGAGGAAGVFTVENLTLRNLQMTHTGAGNGLFTVQKGARIHNCLLSTTATVASDMTAGIYALSISKDGGFECADTEFSGLVKVTDFAVATTDRFNRRCFGQFRDCSFSAPVVLNDIIENAGTVHSQEGLLFEGCLFSSVTYTGQRGILDGRGSQNVTLRDCEFTLDDREIDIIHIGRLDNDVPATNWLIENCQFNIDDTARVSAVNAGANGSDGTGWAIYFEGIATSGNLEEYAANITIRNCYVEGPSTSPTNNDSGAFYLEAVKQAVIADNTIFSMGCGDASRCEVIRIVNTTQQRRNNISIRGNLISKFTAGSATADIYGISVLTCDGLHITDNTIVGQDDGGTAVSMSAISAAIELNSVTLSSVIGNHIASFRENQPTGFGLVMERVSGTGCEHITVVGNNFENNGGFQIDCANGTVINCVISDNTIDIDVAAGQGINVASTAGMVVNGNRINMASGGGVSGIAWLGTSVDGVCVGNSVEGSVITASGGGVIFGVQNSARNDLNFVY